MDGWGRQLLDDTTPPSFLGRFSFLIDKTFKKQKFIQLTLTIRKGDSPGFILVKVPTKKEEKRGAEP